MCIIMNQNVQYSISIKHRVIYIYINTFVYEQNTCVKEKQYNIEIKHILIYMYMNESLETVIININIVLLHETVWFL
jgi:hypothetical protein